MKARIKFRKYGALRFIGHLDVMRFFQKVMRRAEIPIAFTGGYSPHMIMSFASPLGIGLTSDGEYFDIELTEAIDSKTAVKRMNEVSIEGIEIISFRKIPDDKKQTETQTPAAPAKPTVTRPKAVRNVKAKATKKGIRITWKKVSGANGYYIYRSTKKKSGYKKIHVVKKGKTQSYLDKKARKGKTYYYKIRTYKKAGGKKMQSNWSKVVRKKYKNS